MSISEVVGIARDIVTLLALIIGTFIAIFVYFQFAPIFELKIIPTWIDNRKQFLLVRFQVENKSRVRLYSPKGRIQVLEHKTQPGLSLSQWVPFDKTAILPTEQPIEWREPEVIFKSTKEIYPGEVISLERLYHYSQDSIILHIGLQVELKLDLIGRIVTRKKESWRQTTTCFAIKHIDGNFSQ
jgi:hypothetical protein